MAVISLPSPGADFFADPDAPALLAEKILPAYIPGCRWFGGKARQPQRFAIEEILAMKLKPAAARLVLVRVEYASGPAETYLLPVQIVEEGGAGEIARFSDGFALRDALHDEGFRAALMKLIAEGGELPGAHGRLRGVPGRAMPGAAGELASKVLQVEQSNSSLVYGDRIFVKLFRKLEEGMNPDVEITRYLSEARGFEHVPPFAGMLEYARPGREPQVLALALGLIANEGDAWTQTLAAVGQYLALARDLGELSPGLESPALFGEGEDSERLRELAGPFVTRVRQLGVRTAETHLALAAETEDPAFAPEPITAEDQRELSAAVRASAERMFELLRQRGAGDPLLAELLAAEPRLLEMGERIAAHEVQAMKTRTHGDYHLGQVLSTGDDFVLIDFEGEPQRSLAERKKKRSPLRDVAGMLRSFHYAAHSGLNEFPAHRAELTPWAEAWYSLMSRTFLRAWLEVSAGASYLPAKIEEVALLLDAFLIEKAIYEVGYELNNRPDWLGIPVRGILQIVS